MATLTRAESKHMYSWWWDSHISPKNSKWLQENLADTDNKVKQMIKLVEVDEDSFARRAEMYYKKRPELMKLIEEFYRAYRALAERYDHATGVIKQAHKTMAEVFPNQVPFDAADDGSFGSIDYPDPPTPETLVSLQAFHDLDEFHNAEKSGAFASVEARCFSKLAEGKVKKCLNFHDAEDKKVQNLKNEEFTEKAEVLSESERLGRSETDIQAVKEALARLEAEKQAGLLEYQESLRRLSKLESDVLRAQEDSSGLHERASKAEAEVQSLKESLAKLEGEREASLQRYQQCLDRISSLESNVSCAREDAERFDKKACKAEQEALILREELVQLNAEKEACLARYMEALEKIANLENKLLLAEDKASMTTERACNAEKEVAALKEAFDRATEEKESASLQCHKCNEKIVRLESEIALSRKEAVRLKNEMDQGAAKLKVAEEQCLLLEGLKGSMQGELDSFLNKMGVKNQEVAEKQKELGRLQTCVQKERLRFMEAETALRTLQSLHSQTKDELRSVVAELQRRVELTKDMEIHGQSMQDEVQKIRDENKSLSELHLSSSVLIKNMQDEILNLEEGKDNLGSSVKDLQDENLKLKESCQRSEAEMEKLTVKKAVLEQCIINLRAELEDAREKVKALEDSYQLLMREKSVVIAEKATLVSQLEIITENFEKLTARNAFLDNSLMQANQEVEALRKQTKNLEDSCHMLNDDKSTLLNERHTLEFKLETGQQKLEKMENNIRNLQEVGESMRGKLEEEQDKAVTSQFETCILRNIVHDLKETNSSLLSKCEKLLESSKLSEKLILELEFENIEQQEEVNFLSEQVKRLRNGIFQLLKVLDVDLELVYEGNLVEDQVILHRLLIKLDDMRFALCNSWDENQKLVTEKSVLETLHEQLKEEVTDLKLLINTLQQEFRNGNNQLSSLHKDMPKLLQSHEELILRVKEGNHKDELLADEVSILRAKQLKLQGFCQDLEEENCRTLVEKHKLDYENSGLVTEVITLDTLSLIFKNSVMEGSEMIYLLAENMGKLYDDNRVLEEKARIVENLLNRYQMENMNLKCTLEKFEDELKENRITNSQLKLQLISERDELSQKEMELLEAVMVEDGQAKQIIELSERYTYQLKENESIRKSKQNVDAELCRILKKQKQTERRVEMLHSELEKGKREAELWETIAGSFFIELQTSSVREALIKEKFAELTKEYERLEAENCSKRLEFVQMKERFESLECENSQGQAQLAQLLPVLASLRDSVASLESHAIHTESEDDYYKDDASSLTATKDAIAAAPILDGFSDLQDIAVRMKAVENKVMEMKKLSQERSLKALKFRSSRSRRGSGGSRSGRRCLSEFSEKQPAKEQQHSYHITNHQKHASYPYEASELLMKDIMLDQASETSSRNDQLLELWETIDRPRSMDLTVDKLMEPSEVDNNRKVLERLALDVQRLANLQITVQDLKQKVVITENSNPAKAKGVEYVRVKEQLQETDKAIAKLLDINGKLMKKADECSSPGSSVGYTPPSSIADSPETGGSKRRTNISEQARRCSQKIGRLQLEVQKMQFLLLHLDGNSKTGRASGTRVAERNTKVLLKDYLYVGTRTPRRRRKTQFCGCVQPPTSGD